MGERRRGELSEERREETRGTGGERRGGERRGEERTKTTDI
jgi:hypothetical protein